MYNNISKLNRQCPNNTVSYVVKSGDTLYKIATRNKTSIEVLLELNPELNTNLLIPGIVMCVPINMPETQPTCPMQPTMPTMPMPEMPEMPGMPTMPMPPMPPTMPIPPTMPMPITPQSSTVQPRKPMQPTPSKAPIASMPPATSPPVAPIPPIMPMPPVAPPTVSECNGMMYTIRSGDTLYNLARKHDITLYELLNANRNINPYNIQIGQIICIPIPEKKCPYGRVYTIAEGDTLHSILHNFGLSLSVLKEVNTDLDPYNLKVGTVICVPAFTPYQGCETEHSYVIAEGDSLEVIARRLGVSTTELLVLNQYMKPDDFEEVGLRICIPAPTTNHR